MKALNSNKFKVNGTRFVMKKKEEKRRKKEANRLTDHFIEIIIRVAKSI